MLVVAIAATDRGSAPLFSSTPLTHPTISFQFPSTSKSIEPGNRGSSLWLHSACDTATCRPDSSKSTARALPVPASIAIRYLPEAKALTPWKESASLITYVKSSHICEKVSTDAIIGKMVQYCQCKFGFLAESDGFPKQPRTPAEHLGIPAAPWYHLLTRALRIQNRNMNKLNTGR